MDVAGAEGGGRRRRQKDPVAFNAKPQLSARTGPSFVANVAGFEIIFVVFIEQGRQTGNGNIFQYPGTPIKAPFAVRNRWLEFYPKPGYPGYPGARGCVWNRVGIPIPRSKIPTRVPLYLSRGVRFLPGNPGYPVPGEHQGGCLFPVLLGVPIFYAPTWNRMRVMNLT
eukprot:1250618-Rhodomonas_salina.1